ncbi:MAG: hypothetical protein PG980_000470 [Wolbachia endosymbiont of Ctenocephalides felis wCfeJ]|nr:MAG: hypothetical protein PG980_000470 [Wolbachia endosymbiont of Ctenocephalides felis wCfeJ]
MNNDPESVETEHEREQERKMRVAAGLTHPGSYACTRSIESVRREYEQDPGCSVQFCREQQEAYLHLSQFVSIIFMMHQFNQ